MRISVPQDTVKYLILKTSSTSGSVQSETTSESSSLTIRFQIPGYVAVALLSKSQGHWLCEIRIAHHDHSLKDDSHII